MPLTTGEQITTVQQYYLNQGSSVVTEDRDIRQKTHFFYTKVATRLWNSAPYYYRKGDGIVMLTAGVGDMPADFSRFGIQGHPYIQGQLYRPLRYRPPDQLKSLIVNYPQSGTPWIYTLYQTDSAKTAQGIKQILCYPTDNSVLDVLAYDTKMAEMIDAPLALVATETVAAGALTGTFSYQVTFVTARGETEGGVISNEITVAAKDIDLTEIPIWWGRTVTSRKIYRTEDGGVQRKLVTTIADNLTTTFTDSVLDVALTTNVPTPDESVSGTEIFPSEFHDSSLWDGLKAMMAGNQADGRDDKFFQGWDRQVQRMWEEIQQGQNEVHASPPFPGFTGGNSVWNRWTPPS